MKVELLICNCLKCSKNHKKYFNKYLIKRFANTHEFCDGDIKKFWCFSVRIIHGQLEKKLIKHCYLIKIFLQQFKHRRHYRCRL